MFIGSHFCPPEPGRSAYHYGMGPGNLINWDVSALKRKRSKKMSKSSVRNLLVSILVPMLDHHISNRAENKVKDLKYSLQTPWGSLGLLCWAPLCFVQAGLFTEFSSQHHSRQVSSWPLHYSSLLTAPYGPQKASSHANPQLSQWFPNFLEIIDL